MHSILFQDGESIYLNYVRLLNVDTYWNLSSAIRNPLRGHESTSYRPTMRYFITFDYKIMLFLMYVCV
jgi:hypothetical protein